MDVEKLLKDLIALAVENEKHDFGKRFSSYHEGHAYVHEGYDEMTESLNELVESIDLLWQAVKSVDKDACKRATEMGKLKAERVVWYALRMAALFEKLDGGVVHEPR